MITGFNYGHQVLGGVAQYNREQVARDLDILKNGGIRHLRIALSNAAYADGVEATKLVSVDAIKKGFYVIWGVSHPEKLNDNNWQDYASRVRQAAQWAKEQGVNEFQIGNELDATWNPNIQLTDPIGKIKDLASSIRGVVTPLMTTSYAVAQDSREGEWITKGKGSLDRLAYNVYGSNGDFENFKTKIKRLRDVFKDTLYISEWNLHSNWGAFPQDENVRKTEIKKRFDWLQAQNITAYFFTFRGNPQEDGGNAFATIKPDNTLRPWAEVLLEQNDDGEEDGEEAEEKEIVIEFSGRIIIKDIVTK